MSGLVITLSQEEVRHLLDLLSLGVRVRGQKSEAGRLFAALLEEYEELSGNTQQQEEAPAADPPPIVEKVHNYTSPSVWA